MSFFSHLNLVSIGDGVVLSGKDNCYFINFSGKSRVFFVFCLNVTKNDVVNRKPRQIFMTNVVTTYRFTVFRTLLRAFLNTNPFFSFFYLKGSLQHQPTLQTLYGKVSLKLTLYIDEMSFVQIFLECPCMISCSQFLFSLNQKKVITNFDNSCYYTFSLSFGFNCAVISQSQSKNICLRINICCHKN